MSDVRGHGASSNPGSSGSDTPEALDAELRSFLTLLLSDDGLREVRALDVARSKYPDKIEHTESGYFGADDLESLLYVAGHYRGDSRRQALPGSQLSLLRDRPKGVYISLNPIKAAARAKAPARMVIAKTGESSLDVDVERRTRLLIDVDAPREVTHVSASDEEKNQAIAHAEEIRVYLNQRGWPRPIEVDSGNGRQLIYRVDLPASDEGLVERVLRGLASAFPRGDGGVDRSVHNPARIMRLPCTWNRKGFDTQDRPHRMARVLSLPDSFDVVELDKLKPVAALAPAATAPRQERRRRTRATAESTSGAKLDQAVARWNADHPRSFATHCSPCAICGSPDGLKASAGDGSRWTCFSSRHQELAESGRQGAGVRGNGCFTGDSLDIEAWTSKRTRVQVLADDGYIDSPRRGRRAPSITTPPETMESNSEDGDTREIVYFHNVGGDIPLHLIVPRAVELLAAHAADDVYVHADCLAQVVAGSAFDDPSSTLHRSTAPRIRSYPPTVLRERLDGVARWMHQKLGDFGDVKVEERWCPREVVNAVRDRGHWPGLRVLAGVTSAPVLRADLTILEQPGYDAATALLYAPSREYPLVPEKPSTDEIIRALDVLRVPFADFPILTPADHSALLAYLLTLAARPAIRGPVPMTGVTARVPGTGKTLLVDSATLAMTGHLPDKLMMPGGRSNDADAEWRKRIATLALEGSRAALIDNVPDGAMLQSSALASALTTEELTERLLATNRTVRVPHRIVWTFSGNNVTVAADLARRSLSIDLDAKIEDPHLRSTFRIESLLQHVREDHPPLLTAALTILRGFAVAGCPKHGSPALGMFEGWDALIRSCVIWATGADPLNTQKRLRGESPETCNLGALLIAWRDAFGPGTPVQARDLLCRPDLSSVLADAVPGRGDRDPPSSKSLGHYLRRNEGRVVGGLWVERMGASAGVTLWTVREVAR